MIYRTLGRTGLRVSQLGFGAMRLPMTGKDEHAVVNRELAIPMIHAALDAGVNYVDTAVGYCNQDSQRAVGEALRGRRQDVVLSTKNHYYGEDEKQWWQNLEDSLARLQVDHIDIYNHHGINWQRYDEAVRPRVSKWMRKAREQGLIRHICTSFHDNAEALGRILDEDYVSSITVQYNLLDRSLEPMLARARELNVGVVIMGPVGGGRLGADSQVLGELLPEVKRVPELALRFVLANPNVTVALSGMSTMEQVRQNVAVASDPVSLDPEEKALIDRHLARLKSMADLYCTGCGYCLPCPNEVNIPAVFSQYNLGRVYGLWDVAKQHYAGLSKRGKAADLCVRCGECEAKCPQHLPIPDRLAEADEALRTSAG